MTQVPYAPGFDPGRAFPTLLDERTAPRVLFVASSGGHVSELRRLAGRIEHQPSSVWITFDTPQTRSILQGRRVRYVQYVRPRDLLGTLRTFWYVRRLLQQEHFDLVVSTGAAIAVGAFIAARLRPIRTRYIESIARVTGPSTTGRIVAALHLAELRTQHVRWADRRWRPVTGLFDGMRPEAEASLAGPMHAPRLFVTLGTIKPYRFDALVDAVLATGLADERTVWQLGSTTRTDLPGRVETLLSPEEFGEVVRSSDVVITHAGVGTILDLLDRGQHPVVVPRRRLREEHVDDHQLEIADFLRAGDFVTVAEADRLDSGHLLAAARRGTQLSA